MRNSRHYHIFFIIIAFVCQMQSMEPPEGAKILALKELCLKVTGKMFQERVEQNYGNLSACLAQVAEITKIPEDLLSDVINNLLIRMMFQGSGAITSLSDDNSFALVKKKVRDLTRDRETIYFLKLASMTEDWLKNFEAHDHLALSPTGIYAATWNFLNNKVLFRIFNVPRDREESQFHLNVESLQNVFFMRNDDTILVVGKKHQTHDSAFFWISRDAACTFLEKSAVVAAACAFPYFAYSFQEADHVYTHIMQEKVHLDVKLIDFFCLFLLPVGFIVGRKTDDETKVVIINFLENEMIGEYDHGEKVERGVLDSSHTFLACATDSHLYFWDIASKKRLVRLPLAGNTLTQFSWAPNNSSFVMADQENFYSFNGQTLSFLLSLFKGMFDNLRADA